MNKNLTAILLAMETLRKEVDLEVQAQTLVCLLYVAQYGEITIKELGKRMGMSTASASRNAGYWGPWNKGKPGQGMIEYREDHMDRRIKYVTLTSKGKRFLDKLAAAGKGAR